MRIFDQKFKNNKLKYFGQTLLATLSIYIIILFLDVVLDAAVIASLGASCFIAFMMPHVKTAQPRFLIGSHFVAVISAFLCSNLKNIGFLFEIGVERDTWTIIVVSLTVGLTMLIMVLTDTEHPPAAGFSLGLAIEGFNLKTVAVALVGVILLSMIRYVFRKQLINLI